ncbi:MAG: formate/nitrite transporter family protein [Bacteroidota bacterium]|nr:formate/nitrite transporter family protein [Candidatus Kapabacteria bacterium]MDW8075073.1 formate/nitrite transporter family protein [Bacteroidota bacterium]
MYVDPLTLVTRMHAAGKAKAELPIPDMAIRGILSAGLLGYATALAIYVTTITGSSLVGALVFPVGFVILSLLGLELVTGNFALLSFPLFSGEARITAVVRNWTIVFLAHCIGGIGTAWLFAFVWNEAGVATTAPWITKAIEISTAKTLHYASMGSNGWIVAFVKGVLCNWMVSLGAVMAFTSEYTSGKILAMWLPIFTFFALGLEHSVVNLFLLPFGYFLGADFTIADWWWWNQIPVTLGNIAGAVFLTGATLFSTYRPSSSNDR